MNLSIRDITAADASDIINYWRTATEDDLARMGETARPNEHETREFIKQFCANRPDYKNASEDILIWESDGAGIGYSTCKEINFGENAQIHLHMWDIAQRGKSFGAIFFSLSALEFLKRYHLKYLFCQPKHDNLMPNKMLSRIGFKFDGHIDYNDDRGFVITQNRYIVTKEKCSEYLEKARNHQNGVSIG